MAKKHNRAGSQAKRPQSRGKRESVFKEAWDNMNDDFGRFLPESFRHRSKKKFVLWLFVLELLALGAVGKFLYDWLAK